MINIGSGQEKTIVEFAKFIMKKLKVSLKIQYDKKKPNGTPRKKLNTKISKLYGWKSKISLSKGFDLTYKDFLKNQNKNQT